ncbi:MAG: ketopantoate reductase family protein [Firmicutes bacterium]|jgi:2-dehydropantoate 2-reductase|nr:ketopantoate reductase family protein [Bacillota bacterium]
MKILFYGAGVLGSLYAARLADSGHDVTVLARGQRLADIREHGVVLEEGETGRRTVTKVNVVDRLAPDDAYDLAVVVMRKNQVPAVLPGLAANLRTPSVVFMVNNAAGPAEYVAALGRERVLLGFPGAGGGREGHVIRYHVVSGTTQPTTFGELDGRITPRLRRIAGAFKDAGFPVAISTNMDAWLKTHVALVSPIANAIYMAGGNNYRLAHMPEGLALTIRAIREGFRVLRALGIPITPSKLRIVEWIPEPILVAILRRTLNTQRADVVMARHANVARDEMRQLADEFAALARSTHLPTPAMDRLATYI